jgi:hypothetical protein
MDYLQIDSMLPTSREMPSRDWNLISRPSGYSINAEDESLIEGKYGPTWEFLKITSCLVTPRITSGVSEFPPVDLS